MAVFYWFPYRMASYFFTMNYSGYIQLLVINHIFETSIGRKETHVFYVASIIAFSVFLELLWEHILLVRYKLNRLRPPRIKPV